MTLSMPLDKKEYKKKYRTENKEKIAEYRRLWKKTERGKFQSKKDRHKFQITFEEYKILKNLQNDLCAICGKKELKKSLAIDHDHKTGDVRGLLCQKCNRGIGCFNDSIELLKNASHYLS